jgi:hypothetical protein
MPNWCENDLWVEGTEEQLEEFMAFVKGERDSRGRLQTIDFEKIVPVPEDENLEWFSWSAENWGTKWNASHFEDLNPDSGGEWKEDEAWDRDKCIKITFDTAWNPPLPIIKALGKKFPELWFRLAYFEQGMGFNGAYRVENGKVTMNESGDYFGDRGG